MNGTPSPPQIEIRNSFFNGLRNGGGAKYLSPFDLVTTCVIPKDLAGNSTVRGYRPMESADSSMTKRTI